MKREVVHKYLCVCMCVCMCVCFEVTLSFINGKLILK